MNPNQLLAIQHVDYERDLENPLAGVDDCPFDTTFTHDTDLDDTEPPCNYCTATDPCPCTDRGGRFTQR